MMLIALLAVPTTLADARPAAAQRAARSGCDRQHPHECQRLVALWKRRAIHARAAVKWQRRNTRVQVTRVLDQARGAQPFAYAAKLAYLACVSFSGSGCHPPSEMLGVGRCESGLQNHDPNPASTADGFMQFLSGTWASAPAGALGWSRYDPLAMAIATEAIVKTDGGWRQWSCQP